MIRISVWAAVFLVVLRLCIGWHFAYEGFGKVKSAYQGKAAVNEKPFSSETYFRESEGPFGKYIKSKLADPDQVVVDKLTLQTVPGDASDASPVARFPATLAKEWDDYLARFQAEFKLDDKQKSLAQGKFDQAKAIFVKRIQGIGENDPETKQPKPIRLQVKRKAPGAGNASADFDQEMTIAERTAELKKKSEEVRAAYPKNERMGKDVEGANLRALKTEVNTIRAELQKEIDHATKTMQDSLAKLLDTRVTAYAAQADNKEAAVTLQGMLTPMKAGTNPLAKIWDDYAAYVKEFAPNINDGRKAEIDLEVVAAKTRFDRWLADQDMFTGEPLPSKNVAEWRQLYADAIAHANTVGAAQQDAKDEKSLLESRMQFELRTQSDAMRAQVGMSILGEDRAKGYATKPDERVYGVVPKSWGAIEFLDWSTRWFLLVVGCMLMVGLFTRLSSFAAAGFLLLTVLTQPSLPWLPAPPNSEGNYLVINKNVIEMVALLVLMGTRTGKWFGLDAIVSSILGSRTK